jgi:hypothetical protein
LEYEGRIPLVDTGVNTAAIYGAIPNMWAIAESTFDYSVAGASRFTNRWQEAR